MGACVTRKCGPQACKQQSTAYKKPSQENNFEGDSKEDLMLLKFIQIYRNLNELNK